MKPDGADCVQCAFVDDVEHPQLGQVKVCRWGPPQMTITRGAAVKDPHTGRMVGGQQEILGGFPITGKGNWCYQFKQRSVLDLN